MGYLIDTAAVAATRTSGRAPAADRWFRGRAPDELFLSVVTVGDLHRSVMNLAQTDVQTADKLASWLNTLMGLFDGRILALDAQIAERWGTWYRALSTDPIDGLVAATAQHFGLTLVTAERSRYAGLDIVTVDPWDAESMSA